MPAAMRCKTPINGLGETHRNIGKRKTKYACVVNADESMRMRLEGVPHRYHEDHIAGGGMNSLSHFSSSNENTRSKGGSGKLMRKLEKILPRQLTKVRNKKEVIEEARNKEREVHFASLMDLCHLKKSELEPQFQKYQGRVVLRGDLVKDDSGSYAVFTEQGSSASQMTAANVMDIISRPPGCAGQAADAVSA